MTSKPTAINLTGQQQTPEQRLGYEQAINQTLALIEAATDRWLEDDIIDIDCARSASMLTLTLPNKSQIIVNAQAPLQELWLAARSGGYHFSWAGQKNWTDTKTGASFWQILNQCLLEQSGMKLMIE